MNLVKVNSYQTLVKGNGDSYPKMFDTIGHTGIRAMQKSQAILPEEGMQSRIQEYAEGRYADSMLVEQA